MRQLSDNHTSSTVGRLDNHTSLLITMTHLTVAIVSVEL